jgi:hypothetical protein
MKLHLEPTPQPDITKRELRPHGRIHGLSKYEARFAEQAFKLALYGLIEKQMADVFGVSHSALRNWRETYEEFESALVRSKEIADAEVTHALYQRAVGCPAEKIFREKDKTTGTMVTVRVPYRELPDPITCRF